MLALGAEVVATGPKGERTIPIDEFFTGLFATALAPDEILTEIRIPAPPPRSGGAYVKLERKVGDFATAAAAVQVTLGAAARSSSVGIALTNAGPTPIKADRGRALPEGQAARRGDASPRRRGWRPRPTAPSADRRGSVEYKREMARVLTDARPAAGRRAGGRSDDHVACTTSASR